MNHLKDQRGVALILELILVAAVLALAGIAVYSSTHHKAPVAVKSAPTPSASPTLEPYAGWKTYTETYEQANYKYPSSWKFAVSNQPLSPGGPQVETDTLTSPTGLTLTFSSPLQGIGGACGALDDSETVYSADQVSMKNVSKPVYLVVNQLVSNGVIDRRVGLEELAQAPMLRTWNTCGVNFDLSIINSHGKDHLLATFGGGYSHGAPQNSLSFADYQKLPDVINAELILKSLTFTAQE